MTKKVKKILPSYPHFIEQLTPNTQTHIRGGNSDQTSDISDMKMKIAGSLKH